MKDKKILLIIPLVLMLCVTMGIILYDNYTTRKANDKLKKEKYECKQELNKLKDKELERIVSSK